MRKYGHDYEPPVSLGPLFGWPEVAREKAEQRVFPLEPSTEARWQAWKASEDGERFIEAVRFRALTLAKMGEPVIRVKSLVEQVRDALHLSIDNRFQSYVSRELCYNPELEPLIERRIKRAI